MTITITTRRLLCMLQEAYKMAAMKEAVKDPIEENLNGTSEIAANAVFDKYKWEDDFIQQQR
ncbi:MAG TPA: hypothetical protein VKR58_14750 [Aquella sp.]|nr:hypothetical protein [Aquella sp.]